MKNVLILFLSIITLISCEKENENSLNQINEDYSVSLNSALEIVSNMNLNTKSNTLSKNVYKTKVVKNYKEVKNENKKSVFYIINFEEGGFIIFAADKRSQPILASSEKGNFNFNETHYPGGLKFWIEDSTKQMTQIINSNLTPSDREINLWKGIELPISNTNKEDPINTCYEHTEIITKGPLSYITWNQAEYVSNLTPLMDCNGIIQHPFAGCVPLTLAEIMRYHLYPTNYYWQFMPFSGPSILGETERLIKDVHDKIKNNNPNAISSTCSETSVSNIDNMTTVLKSGFGYSSATVATYNEFNVESNLENNLPVILFAKKNDDVNGTGHMWFTDGYKKTTYYLENCYGVGYLEFYMKWGDIDINYNGWFSYDNFNYNNKYYNSNRKMIYNIIP